MKRKNIKNNCIDERWIKNDERTCWIKRKNFNRYLIDDGSGDKKEKCTKKCAIKTKLKFEKHESFLEAAPLENKINHLEKNKTDAHSLKKHHKEFIKTIN